MKKQFYLVTIIILFFYSKSYSQFGVGSPEVLNDIKHGKLIVVVYKDVDNYNNNIKKYIEENWKYGEYQFVSKDSLKIYEKRKDLFFMDIKSIITGSQGHSSVNFGLTISRSPKNFFWWGDSKIVSIVPISNTEYNYYQDLPEFQKLYENGRNTFEAAIAGLNLLSCEHMNSMFKVLFDVIEEFKNEKFALTKGNKASEYYNSVNDISILKNKTLLIPISEINQTGYMRRKNDKFLSIIEISKVYTHDFKIVSEEEFSNLVKSNSDKYFYLQCKEESTIINYFLFDFKTNKLVYFNNERGGIGAIDNITVFEKVLKDLNEIMK